MATLLQFSPIEGLQTLFFETPAVSTSQPEIPCGFEQILALACDRIDAVFGTPQSPAEQRALPRKHTALRAQCVGEWGESPCLVSDVSEGGMAFVCGHLHDVGERVTLRWQTSFGTDVQVDCVVRHVTGPYIGVQFLAPTPEQRWGIRALGVVTAPEVPSKLPIRYVA